MTKGFLAEADQNYDSEICMLGSKFWSPGYHSLVPNDTWVHSTRDSIYYALHLLKTGEPEYEKRAFDIIQKIILLQDTNSYSQTYGIWSWLYEEPVEKMSPPDWNWADFIGVALAHVIKDFGDRLPELLLRKVLISIGHAAWSIFRRNIRQDYTNIVIMGTVVTAVAGEVLNETRLVKYASERLKTFLEYTKQQGGLNEYNSPCYTFIALHESERIVQLVNNQEIKESAEELRYIIWKSVASHYHPATKQLAGPHSRAYSDFLPEGVNHYLDWAVSGQNDSEYKDEQITDFISPLPCPVKYRQRFSTLPRQELEKTDRFIQTDTHSVCGTTWMNQEVTLGSINHECFWTQRRPLLGYWLDGKKQIAILRLRLLKDGKDFSSGGLLNVQSGNKILTGIRTYVDRGDYHIHLDRPIDGIFKFKSLVLRYELTANESNINNPASDQYELVAGDWKAVITTPPGIFNGAPVRWRSGKTQNKSYIEAVLHEGNEQSLLFDESIFVKLALSTELLRNNQKAVYELLSINDNNGVMNVSWQNMSLSYNPYGEKHE